MSSTASTSSDKKKTLKKDDTPVESKKGKENNNNVNGYLVPTMENLKIHDEKDMEVRFFGCAKCNWIWYQKVPQRKPVSHCRKCRTAYQAVALKDEPVGLGFCHCHHCGRKWTSHPAARDVSQPCHNCPEGKEVYPHLVIPNSRLREEEIQMRSKFPSTFKHSCRVCKGIGRCRLAGRPNVPSEEHDSTGSTASLGSNGYTGFLASKNVDKFRHRFRAHAYEDLDGESAVDNLSVTSRSSRSKQTSSYATPRRRPNE